MNEQDPKGLNRRDLLKVGLVAGGAALIGPGVVREVLAMSCHDSTVANPCGAALETYPTSPLIGGKIVVTATGTQAVSTKPGDFTAFTDLLPIPKALPAATSPFGDPTTGGVQDSDGQVHQVGCTDPIVTGTPGWNSTPMFYRIQLKVAQHRFTSKQVVPIDALGNVVRAPGQTAIGLKSLPASTIWGFNGQFPGPMINAEYNRPCLVRFENKLDIDNGLSSQNFGAPDRAFLTHLHNGHTAPESDGNPNHKPCPYAPGQWTDNLYLNWAIGQEQEKQSFFWFHDHRMDHTGANVYKGLVGLYPIYDPGKDGGDERFGLRLPGKRINNADGTFNVDYDIPLAFYDCRLDDGVTLHQDFHLGCKEKHPEWWGKTFFKHYPNHGFVGDIFTVNGKACPVLYVKRRKYRFRMLDASIARQYNFKLMQGKVGAAPGQQGQYNFVDGNGVRTQGEQVMRFRQIASDGGLLPFPIDRDSIELWPAKRREVVVDFRYYMDGISPTKDGDVIYLTNVAQMLDGRKQTAPGEAGFDPNYCVPVLKIVIQGNDAPLDDYSLMPALTEPLRALPQLPDLRNLPTRRFGFDRATVGGEIQWVVNGRPFDPSRDEADPLGTNPIRRGRPELWTFENLGGGWTHPIHLHMEEHQVISRNGKPATGGDVSREDVIGLEGSESVTFYRNFRTFTGKYVAHCHNLSHEDHAMMFGWEIKP